MRRALFPALCLIAATPASAQVRAPQTGQVADDADQQQPVQPEPIQPTSAGRVASSAVGQAGQRQTREQVDNAPTARIANRIQNRVQSRLRNRIDRNYDPQANTTTPFAIAEDQARDAGRTGR